MESVKVEPEYPVLPIEYYQSAEGSAVENPPVVLVTEKLAAVAEVPVVGESSASEETAPPAPEQTLPPVIGEEDPAPSPQQEETPAEDPTSAPAPKPTRAPGGNPEKYPVFSRFFPSRRLHLKGDPEAQAPRAGVKIWPAEPGSSLLNRMLNGD